MGGGEEKADGVIFPLEAMNFSMKPLGGLPPPPPLTEVSELGEDRFVVDRLLVSLDDTPLVKLLKWWLLERPFMGVLCPFCCGSRPELFRVECGEALGD